MDADNRYGKDVKPRPAVLAGIMQVCDNCRYQTLTTPIRLATVCCSPLPCPHIIHEAPLKPKEYICNCNSCVKLRTPKPLAQYLGEYIEHEAEVCNIDYHALDLFAYNSWRELFEQALDAYQSTENVKIKIEKC